VLRSGHIRRSGKKAVLKKGLIGDPIGRGSGKIFPFGTEAREGPMKIDQPKIATALPKKSWSGSTKTVACFCKLRKPSARFWTAAVQDAGAPTAHARQIYACSFS